jgi:hypothetical protein
VDVKTAEDWWACVEAHKDDLRRLVVKFYPIGAESSPDYPISAAAAEAACEKVRKEIAAGPQVFDTPGAAFDHWVEKKDGLELWSIFEATWYGMPESMSVRGEPGFFALCDLCSESWVLEPEEGP